MKKVKLIPYIETITGDIDTPITLYQKYVGDRIGFLLESKEQPKGRYSFLSANPFLTIKANGESIEIMNNGEIKEEKGKALEIAKKYISQYEVKNSSKIPFVGGAVGTVGYDMIRQYEYLPDMNKDDIETPDLHLLFVTELIAYDHYLNKINIIVLEEDNEDASKKAQEKIDQIKLKLQQDITIDNTVPSHEEFIFEGNMGKEEYMEAVRKAKQYIYDGDIFQVVLSRRSSAKCTVKPLDLYRKLRQVNPSPYMFYFNFNDYYIVGSSPEMLVEYRGGKIYNCPIAGTRKRGKTEEEDKLLAEDLFNDEKERAEHIMLVDLGRNDMGKVSKIGTVEVTKYMEVQNYSHVMHMVSLVEGEKRDDKDMFEVLMSFLPAGTLSGAPKIRAMEIIDELEVTKRGIYGGAIGYFGFDGDMDMCIAIRTMVIKDGVVHLQAGAGIVADSDEEKEFEETNNKVRALITAINS